MASKVLKGLAWPSGQIEFSREDNDWAFSKIASRMEKAKEDSVRINPAKAPIELSLAPTTRSGRGEVTWLEELDRLLNSADRVYLDFRGDFLRFRRAVHDAATDRRYVTIGSQEAADDYFGRKVGKIKYFFATRRDPTMFEVESLVNFGEKSKSTQTDPIEVPVRIDVVDENLKFIFSTSGAHVPMELAEWRSSVKEGGRGRFNQDGCHALLKIASFSRPFTMLREYRSEFKNYSYTLVQDKFQKKLDQWVEKRLATQKSA